MIGKNPRPPPSLPKGALKTYKGFPHGMPTTEAATINADLLAFIQE
jgi:non-heme chloroperoxidase